MTEDELIEVLRSAGYTRRSCGYEFDMIGTRLTFTCNRPAGHPGAHEWDPNRD